MTKPAITVQPETSVQAVAALLLESHVRAVAVVDGKGKLQGIVSESDLLVRNAKLHFPTYLGILDTLLPVGGDRNLEDELRKVLAVTAGEVMTADVFTARPGDDLGEVIHDMLQRRIHAVPVVRDGRVEGMLYPTDVLRLIVGSVS